jgi:hypothetical protein
MMRSKAMSTGSACTTGSIDVRAGRYVARVLDAHDVNARESRYVVRRVFLPARGIESFTVIGPDLRPVELNAGEGPDRQDARRTWRLQAVSTHGIARSRERELVAQPGDLRALALALRQRGAQPGGRVRELERDRRLRRT